MKALNNDYLQAIKDEKNKMKSSKNRRENLHEQPVEEEDDDDDQDFGNVVVAFRKDAQDALN